MYHLSVFHPHYYYQLVDHNAYIVCEVGKWKEGSGGGGGGIQKLTRYINGVGQGAEGSSNRTFWGGKLCLFMKNLRDYFISLYRPNSLAFNVPRSSIVGLISMLKTT